MSTFTRHIFVCTNQRSPDDPRGSCSKLGSEALHARFKQEAKRLDLKDVVRANKAGCLDHCAQGPSVVIYPEGVWYQVKSEADVTEIMERLGSKLGAAPTGIVGAPLVGTDENMSGEC